jgi:hypothetical protein
LTGECCQLSPTARQPNLNHPRYLDERGNARVALRRGGNVIRWRWHRGADGERAPVTNARLVKWSDGTESVMLGDQVGGWLCV